MKKLTFIFSIFLCSHLLYSQSFDILANKVMEKDTLGIENLLAGGMNINIQQKSSGATVLILACSYPDYEDMAGLLIQHGADVNLKDNNGKTPLIWAASNSIESVRILISHEVNINEKANDGMTAFMQAVFGVLSGKVPIAVCELLKENGADINAVLDGGSTPGWAAIHFAVMEGDTDLVKYLVMHGANVNLATNDGSTPLFLAKSEKNDEVIKILKTAGAR